MTQIDCSELGMKKGKGFQCHPVVEACAGCTNIVEIKETLVCKVYPEPEMRWMIGSCPLATHVEQKVVDKAQKINPLKASKRAAAGK